jgi:DNA-binding NarL/FixJ family response regulator
MGHSASTLWPVTGEFARRLLVVEDEPLMASLLADTLRAAGFEVATAGSVKEARELVEEFDPDMALLDIALGNGPTGVHLAHVLTVSRPDIAILFLTRHADAESASSEGLALPPNVGFLRKHMVSDTAYLLDAIEKVFAERAEEVRQVGSEGQGFDGLSPQAMRVLRLLAEGHSNAEIARRSGMSVKSVERWIDVIYHELEIEKAEGLNRRVEAARRYYLAAGIPEAASP